MADIIRYIDRDNNGGGTATGTTWADAYPTLDAWQTAEATDLVTATDNHIVYYRAASSNPRTSSFTMSGWTQDATHRVKVVVPPESRHTGRPYTGTHFDGGGFISSEYTILEGLHIYWLTDYHVISNCVYNKMLIWGMRVRNNGASNVLIQNTIMVNPRTSGNMEVFMNATTGSQTLCVNCIGISSGTSIVFRSAGQILTVRSCFGHSYGGGQTYEGHNISRSNCYGTVGTDMTGVTIITLQEAGLVEDDWDTGVIPLLTSASVLIGASEDNSAYTSGAGTSWYGGADDIFDTARPQGSAWDIGAHEFAVVVPMPQYIYGE